MEQWQDTGGRFYFHEVDLYKVLHYQVITNKSVAPCKAQRSLVSELEPGANELSNLGFLCQITKHFFGLYTNEFYRIGTNLSLFHVWDKKNPRYRSEMPSA